MALTDVANFVIETLIPDGETARLIFRRFEGRALSKAAQSGKPLPTSAITTVVLRVNPQQMDWNSARVTTKTATNAPERFIINDWGLDLTILRISGVTGNLLPDTILNNFDPAKNIIEDVVSKIDPTNKGIQKYKTFTDTVGAYAGKTLIGSLDYFELLNMSNKYRSFKALERMYQIADFDLDVITLEFGENILRGYFTEFNFTVTAMSPWNWSYNIGFVQVNDLSEAANREDDAFPDSSDPRMSET
jgi:hypothetical protein